MAMPVGSWFIPVLFFVLLKGLSVWQCSTYPNSLRFRFKSYGYNENKDTIIIVPGLDGIVTFFEDIIPELTEKYHVLAFHIPLFAQDMKQQDYTFSYLAKEMKTIIDELGIEKVSIVGESFGGVIAQHFAVEYPSSVDRLVLLSSLARTQLPPEIQWKLDYLMPVVEAVGGSFPSLAQWLFAQIHVYDVVEPSEPQFVRDMFIKEATYAHFHSVVARIRIVAKLDIVAKIGAITAPALILYGDDDHFTKEASQLLAELIPNSALASLPGGHLAHISNPKTFADKVKEFIQ